LLYGTACVSFCEMNMAVSICRLRRPEIDLTLHSSDKAVTPPEVFNVRFYELCDHLKKNKKLLLSKIPIFILAYSRCCTSFISKIF